NPVAAVIITSHGRQFDRAVFTSCPRALGPGRVCGSKASGMIAAVGSAAAMVNTGPKPQLFASNVPAARPTNCGQPTATPYQADPLPSAPAGNSSAMRAL